MSSEVLELYKEFIKSHIILTVGEEVYETDKYDFVTADLNMITFKKKKEGSYYYYKQHIMIINHIAKGDSTVHGSIKKFIEGYDVKPKENNIVDYELYKQMGYLYIGNREFVVNNLEKFKKEKFDKYLPEWKRLIMINLFLSMNRVSFRIEPGIPISVIKNDKISNEVNFCTNIYSDGIEAGKSKYYYYKYPSLIINAMYYKIKIGKYDKELFSNTFEEVVSKKHIKGKIKAFEKHMGKQKDFPLKNIKEKIDLVSLADNKQNIYMMIQLLGKMFTIDQLNCVINKILQDDK